LTYFYGSYFGNPTYTNLLVGGPSGNDIYTMADYRGIMSLPSGVATEGKFWLQWENTG